MQSQLLSLRSLLAALDLDPNNMNLLEQMYENGELTTSNTPEGIYATIRAVGTSLNTSETANQFAENLEERINIIAHKLKFIAAENKPKVLVLEDVMPVTIKYNEYLDNLIRIAGGTYLNAMTDSTNPDIIIVVSNKQAPQVLQEIPTAFADPQWSQTAAAMNGNVYIVYHSLYLVQPGAQIADDTEILAEILHPKLFFFGREEDVWMKFDW